MTRWPNRRYDHPSVTVSAVCFMLERIADKTARDPGGTGHGLTQRETVEINELTRHALTRLREMNQRGIP